MITDFTNTQFTYINNLNMISKISDNQNSNLEFYYTEHDEIDLNPGDDSIIDNV